MLKKMMKSLFVVTVVTMVSSVCMAQVTVDEAAIERAKNIRERIATLQAEIASNKSNPANKAKKQQIDKLLVEAADLETRAHKMGDQCQQGSHQSISYIKQHYSNCQNCREESFPKGCPRKKGAHKHYYCYCDC